MTLERISGALEDFVTIHYTRLLMIDVSIVLYFESTNNFHCMVCRTALHDLRRRHCRSYHAGAAEKDRFRTGLT